MSDSRPFIVGSMHLTAILTLRRPVALAIFVVTTARASAAEQLAFPGAEGFGAHSRGGRGGRVLLVTSLADYRPGKDARLAGTLRAACEASGPRIVVFRVAGTIELKASLKIREPYLTLAGQSAPGGGICLKDFGVSIAAEHVIVRHLRFRPGDEIEQETDALSLGSGARHVIVDHCSTSWANDEVLSVSGAGITDVTVQWCIISESLNRSHHRKGAHGYGSLIRTNGDVTFHHNLYAHHSSRSPRPGTYGDGSILLDFRNNVIYRGGRGYTAADPARINYVGNWVIDSVVFRATETTKMYAAGNWLVGAGKKNDDSWRLISGVTEENRMAEPFPVAPVETDTAKTAFSRVLETCGAVLPRRDAVDRRIVRQVREGKGELVDSQREVGGWPELEPGDAPEDADGDGMPDGWEELHGLDPREPSDRGDEDRDGYTNLEECLNGTDPGRRNP